MSTHPRTKLPGSLRAIVALPNHETHKPKRLSEEEAARTLTRFGTACYIANLEGEIIYSNPQYEKIAEDIRGGKPESTRPVFAIAEVIARVLAGEEDVIERIPARINGAEIFFHGRHYPVRNDNGTITGITGIYLPVSQRTLELRRAKERYDDISRLSFDMIWETGPDFSLTYFSPRVTDVLGFHPRELIGRNLLTLGSFESTEDVVTRKRRSPFRDSALSITHRDGRIRRLKLSGLPIFSEDNGTFCGYRGTATDVSAETEARESANISRERQTTAIENISEGFALYDRRNQMVLCNNRFREYLVGAQHVLFPGAPLHGILHALDERGIIRGPENAVDAWLDLRARAIREGEGAIEINLSSGRWLRVTDRPTEDGGIVSIVSDITEAKDREETLRTAKDLAEQGSRSKSEFLANMSHELRTPLNAIIGFSEIMRAETLGPVGSPRYIEYLDDIIESSQHLLGVINDILDVAKSEAGKTELNEEPVNMLGELQLTSRLFAEQAAEADVSLAIQMPDLMPKLMADQRKIRQILLNLVSNAVKFTPPGGSVTVSVSLEPDGGMTLVVADTGIGIDKDDIPRALSPFGQVESSLSRRYEGTGLGLPLTRALVECHGGTLELDSEPGKGTRVYARFPHERVIS